MIIKVENLVKRYGELIALDHLNLEIKAGEVYGLLGPNGSGKSTAIHCILSLLKYDKGDIQIFGKKMTPNAFDIKKDIGVILQDVAVFEELSVYENIDYFCGLYINDKQTRKRYVEDAIEFTGLNNFKKFRPKALSGGLLRRLNIACGIAHKPKLVILDEPTVAVDPQSRNNILEGIQELNRQGVTILYTSHYMEEIEQICTNIGIMDHGKIIASGTKEDLKNMIAIKEKITIEIWDLPKTCLDEIREMPNVLTAEYQEKFLNIKSKDGKNNLTVILSYLQESNITYEKIYSELPTLNDVFLEITGKGLRDHV